jgi:DNA polymerase-3 subunit alpha
MHGASILSPCINHSYALTVIHGKNIYLGFALLHSLESKVIKKITSERDTNGYFLNLDDFIDRVPISMEQTAILIKTNGFRFTGRNKRELLWEAHMKINKVVFDEQTQTLFKAEKINYQTPKLPNTPKEDAFDEIELLGFPLCDPFQLLLKPSTHKMRAKHLSSFVGQYVSIQGYLVTTKNTVTSNGKRMYFGTFLDRDGYFIDTVHFPPVATKYRFRGKGIYTIQGKVIEEFDCLSLEVTKMKRLAIIEDPRYSDASLQINSTKNFNRMIRGELKGKSANGS